MCGATKVAMLLSVAFLHIAATSVADIEEVEDLHTGNRRFVVIFSGTAGAAYEDAAYDYMLDRGGAPGFPGFSDILPTTPEDIHSYPDFQRPEGVRSPEELKAFLEYAHEHWSPAPEYVLLIGPPSVWPEYYIFPEGTIGAKFWVSNPLVDPPGAYSDAWIVDFDDDDERWVPEIPIGRLSALTADEIARYDQKAWDYVSQATYTGFSAPGQIHVLNGDFATTSRFNSAPFSFATAGRVTTLGTLPKVIFRSSTCTPPHDEDCLEQAAIAAAQQSPVLVGIGTRSNNSRFMSMASYLTNHLDPAIFDNAGFTPYAVSIMCGQACYDYKDHDLEDGAAVVHNCLFDDAHRGMIAFSAPYGNALTQGMVYDASAAFVEVVDSLYQCSELATLGTAHLLGHQKAAKENASWGAWAGGYGLNFYGDPTLPIHKNFPPVVSDIVVDDLGVTVLDPIVHCTATADDANGDEDYSTLDYLWDASPPSAGTIGPVPGQPWNASFVSTIPPAPKVNISVTVVDASGLTGVRSEKFTFMLAGQGGGGLNPEGTSEGDSVVARPSGQATVTRGVEVQQGPNETIFLTRSPASAGEQHLRIVDIMGREVAALRPDGRSGDSILRWTWRSSESAASGVYLYIWESGSGEERTGKFLYVR